MTYISPHYQETLTTLAEKLVTPARYGKVAVTPLVEMDIPIKNLGGLFDVDA